MLFLIYLTLRTLLSLVFSLGYYIKAFEFIVRPASASYATCVSV